MRWLGFDAYEYRQTISVLACQQLSLCGLPGNVSFGLLVDRYLLT
jgi:hypothetical protein